jgi:hypothetical protein
VAEQAMVSPRVNVWAGLPVGIVLVPVVTIPTAAGGPHAGYILQPSIAGSELLLLLLCRGSAVGVLLGST